MNNKRLYMRTFGCQMNARDSEHVAGVLIDNGFRMTDRAENADVVLFNSCSVRKHAEEKLFSNISELVELKKKRPGLVVGLIGCTAQIYKADAIVRAPVIDIVCGPGNETDLPALINDALKNGCQLVATDKVDRKRPELFPDHRESAFKAYVSIGEGCDNYCSYCIVPYARGRERSRAAEDIVGEVEALAARGFKEIMLLGQNVNSYRGLAYSVERPLTGRLRTIAYRKKQNAKTYDFIRLLEQLNKIKGIERIRFMTSHPKDAGIELFKAMRDLDKVCEHLHLPLQSGSDRILKLMNRKYTAAKYMKDVDEYRRYVPDGSITTDVVVGFPSERDADFMKTYDMMKRVGFDASFTFKYSPRPPAAASKLKDGVSTDVKTKRLLELVELQCKMSEARNAPAIGKALEVLVDGTSKKDDSVLSGRTRTNKTVVFKGPKSLNGKFVDVKIESVTPYALKGKIVG